MLVGADRWNVFGPGHIVSEFSFLAYPNWPLTESQLKLEYRFILLNSTFKAPLNTLVARFNMRPTLLVLATRTGIIVRVQDDEVRAYAIYTTDGRSQNIFSFSRRHSFPHRSAMLSAL